MYGTIHLVTMFNRYTINVWFIIKLKSIKISIVEMNVVFWEYTNERIVMEKVYKYTNNKDCLPNYVKYNWHYKISKLKQEISMNSWNDYSINASKFEQNTNANLKVESGESDKYTNYYQKNILNLDSEYKNELLMSFSNFLQAYVQNTAIDFLTEDTVKNLLCVSLLHTTLLQMARKIYSSNSLVND